MLPPLAPPLETPDGPRGLTVLGSTGSIGRQTLQIAALFPERLTIRALASGSDWAGLAEQARAIRPTVAVVADPAAGPALADALEGTGVRSAWGPEALAEIAAMEESAIVVAAIVGAAGVAPTLAAVAAGKTIALANKETLVMAGALVEQSARESGARIIPVDSEHSAIFQCLIGESTEGIDRIVLTASGGPFRTRPAADFAHITPAEALAHPNWSMGAKVTIDSSTLMNKGLEVIEARWLFGLEADRIDVLVHPQSIVHSIVEFVDGSSKAQLGAPDMRVPIQYALTWPARWPAPHPRVDWSALGRLDFERPDLERFPCLGLAFDALRRGGTAPAVLNAANEVAVARFLREEVRFLDIPRLVESALTSVNGSSSGGTTIDALWEADREARAIASGTPAVAV
jgi:1-deoxy-D-xylulose-5-phosphate reductoisomerase